ncbi:MAG: UDP-N-acetylmuramoyl-L-alanine--D-glutamate ligase [Actinobacteria bacterium]|nr:UDP-N-acetylmuramoyl-L-alanine--D-glutamate ligase [Actinomycetota bacterium]
MAERHPALRDVGRALVIGTGRSGLAATRALVDAGVEVLVVDEAAEPAGAADVRATGAELRAGEDPADHLAGVDLVVPSPGVPEHARVLVAAVDAGRRVWSEPELGARLHPRRLVAVTGTNGKTSVTELTTAVLAAGGLDAVACGNIGTPFTEAAAASAPDAVLVAELSSFQLRFCSELRPEVGLLLNLAPDHLDWHGGFEAYGAAKARLWQAQRAGDWAVHNDDDATTVALADASAPAGRAAFSAVAVPDHGVGVRDGMLVSSIGGSIERLLSLDELPLRAPHHVANLAAAATTGLLLDLPAGRISEVLVDFRPGRHRVEHVVEVDGVAYVDDSKATNTHAAAAALASFDRVVWIAGGIAKGVDLSVLADALERVTAAVVIGEAADELAAVCASAGVEAQHAGSMEDAVVAAARLAHPGDTVLLAPACSSFDMFRDYADRGERFAAAARALASGRTSGEVAHDRP